MTVSTTTSRADYTGNGVTTAFAVPFYFLDNSHLIVYRTDTSTGVATTLALGTDYSVTGAGVAAGGTVTCVSAPTSLQKISILRNVPLTQLVHYVPNDPFPAATHEQALDQLTMEMQQVQEQLNRAVKVAVTDTTSPDALISTVINSAASASASATSALGYLNTFKGQYYGSLSADPALDPLGAAITAGDLYFNTTTLRMRVYTGSAWADTGVATPTTVNVQRFSGNASTTVFTLTNPPAFQNACEVFISGVRQVPGVDYTVTGVTLNTLTFTTAPPTGTNNVFVQTLSAYAGGVPNDGSVTPAKLSAGGPSWVGSGNELRINSGSAQDWNTGNSVLRLGAVSSVYADSSAAVVSVSNAYFDSLGWKRSGALAPMLYSLGYTGAVWQSAPAGSVGSSISSFTTVAEITSSGTLKFDSGFGSAAAAYGCRAWVNFNGTGTVAIRSSGNVSSITDNGVGDYTLNFTNAMPDANYALVNGASSPNNRTNAVNIKAGTTPTASSVQVYCSEYNGSSFAAVDLAYANIAIFR